MVLVTKMDFAVDRGGGEEPCQPRLCKSEQVATGQLGNWATTAAKLATSLLTSFRVVVDEVSPFSLECTMIIHVTIVKRKKINLVNIKSYKAMGCKETQKQQIKPTSASSPKPR